jgi:hypothetical protein
VRALVVWAKAAADAATMRRSSQQTYWTEASVM